MLLNSVGRDRISVASPERGWSVDTYTVVGFILAYVALTQYVFRFQRTTRGISQLLADDVSRSVQMVLTPTWLGVLGWLSTMLGVVTTVVVWFEWGWIGLGMFLLYALVGDALVDVVSPLPTYRHCFDVIERELRSSPDATHAEQILEAVQRIKTQYLSN